MAKLEFENELFIGEINADKYAIDYKTNNQKITNNDKFLIKMIINGGFAAKITKD